MSDIFGRMMAAIAGVVLMFMVPLTIIMLKQDEAKQTVIDDAVVEFVDNARASGEITPNAYAQLMHKINSAQPCDVTITYESSVEVPGADNTYKRNLQLYSNEDILSYMYFMVDNNGNPVKVRQRVRDSSQPDGYARDEYGNYRYVYVERNRTTPIEFPLREGGYLSVTASNKNSTPGTQMMRMFIPRYAGKNIYSTYSGYVGNRKQ